jgi:hypothetical protein
MPQDMRVVVDGYDEGFDDPDVKEGYAGLDQGDRNESDHLDRNQYGNDLSVRWSLVVVIGR